MRWSNTLRRWARRLLGRDSRASGSPVLHQIEHVVVVMLENRSFDHVLGSLGPRVDGVAADMANLDLEGNLCRVGPLSGPQASTFLPGPPHDRDAVAEQIGGGKMDGFVRAYQQTLGGPSGLDPGAVMRHLERAHQPVTYFLADEYTVCDRWFAPVPADTLPNRLYSLAGDAGDVVGTAASPALAEIPALVSIFEQLDPADWRIFSGSVPLAFALSPLRTLVLDHERWSTLSDFAAMVPRLPRLTWIEPTYYWVDTDGGLLRRFAHVDPRFALPNDDHPPSQTEHGQELLRYIYEALIAHPNVWSRTVLIVTYDEHGGFYDHVAPPPIAPEERGADGFTTRGPRVPALIVSPYAARGAVCSRTFDHCSILKFLCDWLGLPKWTKRIASEDIASIADALMTEPRTDRPVPPPAIALPVVTPPLARHHMSLPDLVHALQLAAYADNPRAYETVRPEARLHPPGTPMPPAPASDSPPSEDPPSPKITSTIQSTTKEAT